MLSSVVEVLLGVTLSCALTAGCVDGSNIANDNTAGSRNAKDSGNDVVDAELPDDNDPIDQPGDQTPGPKRDDAGDPKPADAGDQPPVVNPPTDGGMMVPVVEDAGGGMMTTMKYLPGSATKAMCSSYGKATAPMCAGYFCGVTQAQIAAEMPTDTLCGASAAEGACNNKLPTAVAKCARDVKPANPFASNASNRPKVQACVFKDAELQAKTPLPCMSCFLDAAECAGDNCLTECLAGDSKKCDACRAKNKCDTKVFTCAKLPSPF